MLKLNTQTKASLTRLFVKITVALAIILNFTPIMQAGLVSAHGISSFNFNSLALAAISNPNYSDDSEDSDIIIQNSVFLQATGSPVKTETVASNPVKKVAAVAKKLNFVAKGKVLVTAYSSTIDQTDASPFTTANGSTVHVGTIACNFLPFGTKVRFPEKFGDQIFVVEDRMNKRHNDKMDIWMESRAEALQFGVRTLAYEIVQ
jgi:3D (Asp-Asp-Asp) domain-containing protein